MAKIRDEEGMSPRRRLPDFSLGQISNSPLPPSIAKSPGPSRTIDKLAVFVNGSLIGELSRSGERGYSFIYEPDAKYPASLGMHRAMRVYDSPELHPAFDMSLPETDDPRLFDAVRRYVRLDKMGQLLLTGASRIGRLRFGLDRDQPPMDSGVALDVGALRGCSDGANLFDRVIRDVGARCGVSGVMPKVLFNDVRPPESAPKAGGARTIEIDTHILKASTPDYPLMSANEFLSMLAARESGLLVPDTAVSADGELLASERFDLGPNRTPIGFEDLLALQVGMRSEKYSGSYESLAKTLRKVCEPDLRAESMESFFKTVALSVAVGNGDFHKKNFGVVYDNAATAVRAAPIYDVVSTTVYRHHHDLALSLEGSHAWPSRDVLTRFGERTCMLSKRQTADALDAVIAGVDRASDSIDDMRSRISDFNKVGQSMELAWGQGVSLLKGDVPAIQPLDEILSADQLVFPANTPQADGDDFTMRLSGRPSQISRSFRGPS